MPFQPLEFPFIKAQATGNDFLLVDLQRPGARELWEREFGRLPRSEWVIQLCDRHFGLGADGVVFIESADGFDFAWDFFNSDGGQAEMCGNAARAVSLYFYRVTGKPEIRFHTRVGPVHARVPNVDQIEVELPPIREERWGREYDFVNSGVPHVLLNSGDLKNLSTLRQQALEIKRRPEFSEHGTNVTFLKPITPNQIESVTFERGVEDFTLACGTGAIAAAHSVLRGRENQRLQVQVPGGCLTVLFKDGRPRLIGPARIVGQMHWIKE